MLFNKFGRCIFGERSLNVYEGNAFNLEKSFLLRNNWLASSRTAEEKVKQQQQAQRYRDKFRRRGAQKIDQKCI